MSSARSPVRSLFLSNSLNFCRHYFPFLSSTHDPSKMPVGPAHVYKYAFSLPRDHDKIYFLCHSKFRRVRPLVVRTLFVFVSSLTSCTIIHIAPPPSASLTGSPPYLSLLVLSFLSISLLPFFQPVVPLRASSFHYICSQHYLQWDKWITI